MPVPETPPSFATKIDGRLVNNARRPSRRALARTLSACAALAFFTCICTPDRLITHEVTYQAAFMMDSVTAGIVGWEYDFDDPNTDWLSPTISNCDQKLWKYSFVDSSFEEIAVLEKGADTYMAPPFGVYTKPWIFYATRKNGAYCGALYNVDTKTTTYVVGEGSAWPKYVSPSGRYVCFAGTVYDVESQAAILTMPEKHIPFYLNETQQVAYIEVHDRTAATEFTLRVAFDGRATDTIPSMDGFFIVLGITNLGKSVVTQTADSIHLFSLSSLDSGAFGDNIVLNRLDSHADICLTSGFYVFVDAGCLVGGNFLSSQFDERILSCGLTEKR